MLPVDQQVLNDNKEIYLKIQSALLNAKSEIIVATAWFTDDHLFSILYDKLDKGVAIEIIIADNQDNEKLDFNKLVARGAFVYKIKGSGYGNMNQKFCVIDRQLALHGSYNWTLNAKKNNHESIISTNHQGTIDALIENFNTLKNAVLEQGDAPVQVTNPSIDRPIESSKSPEPGTEFQKVLDSMIDAEIVSFDRRLLREQGFQRCSANNGDHNVLYNSFDTLYSVFINDIDVIDDKKNRLISKIEEYKLKSKDTLEKECELQINSIEEESRIHKSNLEIKAVQLKSEIDVTSKTIDDIKENKIPAKEIENEDLNKQIKVIEQASVQPIFKWFEFIPTGILNIALLIYLFIFYSSAAYILIFSEEDARIASDQGIRIATAQVFNPDALALVLNKTTTATIFIILFVFIPLALAIADLFVSMKWKILATVLSIVLGILVLDGVVAYKVAESVHAVNYIQGTINELWKPVMAFKDTNFYLVFVLGAFGLLLFKLVFKKLISIFEERSPDKIAQTNQLKIKQLREEVMANADKITLLKENVSTHEKHTIQLKVDIQHAEIELRELPLRLN